jgi:peptide deformylase
VNPRIVSASEETAVYNEGCLSLPEHFAEIERPARVLVEHLDRDGKLQRLDADGLLARCVQHEMDHLEGVLFIDHLSRLKRTMALKKLEKLRKAA